IYAYDRNGNCNCYGGLPCITLYDYADLNQDGSVTILDAVLLQKHLLNFKKLTTEQMKLADINSDGRVNILDMSLLKEKLK
ncbi:MAG: dockerin type I repeat-containing protein, partial [Ruminococcus sp.]